MRTDHVYEYDGYKLPTALTEETPETRTALKDAMERIKALAAQHHKEAEEKKRNV